MQLYLERISIIHSMHPVSKLVCMFIICAWTLTFAGSLWLLPVLAFLIGCGYLARVLSSMYRCRYFLLILFLVSVILWSLTFKEQTSKPDISVFFISGKAFFYGMGMGLRLVIMLLTGILFVSTTRIEDFTSGLSGLGIPYRISFTLSLAFRLVGVFISSGEKVLDSQRIRGLDLEKGNIIRRVFRYIPVIIPIFMSAVRHANDLSVALESKGFGYGPERTEYTLLTHSRKDFVIPGILLAIEFLFLILRFSGIAS